VPPSDEPAPLPGDPALPRAENAAGDPTADPDAFRAAILAWFDKHGRRLDIRALAPDPWAVLVSEVMAQQTQITRVEERLPAFLATFPTPGAMAAAPPAEVVRAWRGLGYNRRAIALHRAALAIVAAGGRVPYELAALEALPGVGPYTARAVAAIAFGRPVGAVDVNVRRVLGRLVASDPAAVSARSLQATADELVDPRRPGAWTHAVMDLGATVCRPARPACPSCPARPWCVAAATQGVASGREPDRDHRSARPIRPVRVPFELTRRWLRGRIVDRLRDAPPGAAVPIDGPLGSHPAEAVAAALGALARDGIVELDAAGHARLTGHRQGGPVAGEARA
jgi:A/G-specific adenine glycosylase